MRMFLFLLSGLLCANVVTVCNGNPPEIRCPQLVEEGTTLTCDCITSGSVTSPFTLTWPGHSTTNVLTLNDVRRELNGTGYTCQMTTGGVTSSSVYILQVAYGPNNVTIFGPTPFATNGSGSLTLTCGAAEVNPVPSYTWSGVACDNSNLGNTCSFKPLPTSDDGRRVACTAASTFVGSSLKTDVTIFTVDLQYPPTDPPVVTSVDGTDFLRSGDVINCTVVGGKPRVTKVNFFCTAPPLSDGDDVIDNDVTTGVTSVVSSLTVDPSRGYVDEMICFCFASWSPDESLYAFTNTVLLPVEYPATITTFTVNDVSTSLTITENDIRAVDLLCSAEKGRPRPNITVSKMAVPAQIISVSPSLTSSRVTLDPVTCENAGVYVCTVTNGLGRPDQQVARLNILCGPRAPSSDERTVNLQNPPPLSKSGLTFAVVANPVPDNITYSVINVNVSNNVTSITKTAAGNAVNGQFSTTCTKVKDIDYSATCELRPLQVTSEHLGVYSVTVGNALGSYVYYFAVTSEILQSASARQSHEEEDVDAMPVGAVVGGAVGGVLLVAVVVVVVACLLFRRRGRDAERARQHTAQQRPRMEDDDDFEEHINEAYVSADTLGIDTTVAPRRPPPVLKKRYLAKGEGGGGGGSKASVTSQHEYEDVTQRASMTSQSSHSLEYASISEVGLSPPSALKGLARKRASRVSFKLDGESDTYASVEDAEGGLEGPAQPIPPSPPPHSSPNPTPLPSGEDGDHYAIPDPEGGQQRFDDKKGDYSVVVNGETEDFSLSGDYAEIGKVVPQQKQQQQQQQQKQATAVERSEPLAMTTVIPFPSADVKEEVMRGSFRGPLGDIYCQIQKPPRKPPALKPRSQPTITTATTTTAATTATTTTATTAVAVVEPSPSLPGRDIITRRPSLDGGDNTVGQPAARLSNGDSDNNTQKKQSDYDNFKVPLPEGSQSSSGRGNEIPLGVVQTRDSQSDWLPTAAAAAAAAGEKPVSEPDSCLEDSDVYRDASSVQPKPKPKPKAPVKSTEL